jgi:hypothetical protein
MHYINFCLYWHKGTNLIRKIVLKISRIQRLRKKESILTFEEKIIEVS